MSATAPAEARPVLPAPPTRRAWTALAPMQDVTTLPFMRILGQYGCPDFLFTEYFRVHGHSHPEEHIVDSILHHGTGAPVFAQMIGESIPDLLRTVEALRRLPIAGIDLNMGCPAPKVYKKNVGGGLLRDPAQVDRILAALRSATPGPLTVKMRIGFEDDRNFEALLDLLIKHRIDLLSLHARTVKEGYRSEVHYAYIRRAVEALPCPVLANGNITSPQKALAVLAETGAAGVMVGRACIRNPWIFRQIHALLEGQPVYQPTLGDVRGYIEALYGEATSPIVNESARLARLKKFLNFIGIAVDPDGAFLHAARRVRSYEALSELMDQFLSAPGKSGEPYPDEPYTGLVARPNCEVAHDGCAL